MGACLIGLTIQIANQRGFYLFNHHSLLRCLLDWPYNPNSQSKRFLIFLIVTPCLGAYLIGLTIQMANQRGFYLCNLGLDLSLPASSPIFIHISGLTSDCQFFKFSIFHLDLLLIGSFFEFSFFSLDLPLIASSLNFHFFIWTYSQLPVFSNFHFFLWTYL